MLSGFRLGASLSFNGPDRAAVDREEREEEAGEGTGSSSQTDPKREPATLGSGSDSWESMPTPSTLPGSPSSHGRWRRMPVGGSPRRVQGIAAAMGSPAARPWRSPGATATYEALSVKPWRSPGAPTTYKTPSTKKEESVGVHIGRSRSSSLICSSGDWTVGVGSVGEDGDAGPEQDQQAVPLPTVPASALERSPSICSPGTGSQQQRGEPPRSRGQAVQLPSSPGGGMGGGPVVGEAAHSGHAPFEAVTNLQSCRVSVDGHVGFGDAVDADNERAPHACSRVGSGPAAQGAGVTSTGGVFLQARAALAALRLRQVH